MGGGVTLAPHNQLIHDNGRVMILAMAMVMTFN